MVVWLYAIIAHKQAPLLTIHTQKNFFFKKK